MLYACYYPTLQLIHITDGCSSLYLISTDSNKSYSVAAIAGIPGQLSKTNDWKGQQKREKDRWRDWVRRTSDGRWNDWEWKNDGDQARVEWLLCLCVCMCAHVRPWCGWVVLSTSNCLCVKLQLHCTASGPIRMTFSRPWKGNGKICWPMMAAQGS